MGSEDVKVTAMNMYKYMFLLLKELPYYSCDIIPSHSHFNNSLNTSLPTKKYLERLPSFNELDIFTLNSFPDRRSDPYTTAISCRYFSPHSFCHSKRQFQFSSNSTDGLSLFHTNIRSLKSNLEKFQTHLLEEIDFHFNIIGITETRIGNELGDLDFNPMIPNYNFEYVPTPLSAGGVGIYIDQRFKYTVIEKTSNEAYQALWVEFAFAKKSKYDLWCGL